MTSTASDSGDKRRFSPISGWVRHGKLFGVVIGATGVALGYVGYRDLYDEASGWDAFYSSLQLVVLNAGSTPDGVSTPFALNLGRFLCAVAFSSTIAYFLAKYGVAGADRFRASRSRGRRVVFGTAPIARELARVAVADSTGWKRWWCGAVLVGKLGKSGPGDDSEQGDLLRSELRNLGVVVLTSFDDAGLRRLVERAGEVVIAESDDADGLELVHRVRQLALDHGVPFSVLLNSSALARGLRIQWAATSSDIHTSIVSLGEAAAAVLAQRFPTVVDRHWEHVVVAGRGDVAGEVVWAAVGPSAVPGEQVTVHAFADPDETWPLGAQQRLPHRDAQLVIEQRRHDPATLSTAIINCCAATPGPHLVFIAGMADPEAIAVGSNLASRLAHSRVVTLLERDPLAASTIDHAADTGWHRVTFASLLSNPALLRSSVAERLGRLLADELDLLRLTGDPKVDRTVLGQRLGSDQTTVAGRATAFAVELHALLLAAGVGLGAGAASELSFRTIEGHREAIRHRLLAASRRVEGLSDDEHRAHLGFLISSLRDLIDKVDLHFRPSSSTQSSSTGSTPA